MTSAAGPSLARGTRKRGLVKAHQPGLPHPSPDVDASAVRNAGSSIGTPRDFRADINGLRAVAVLIVVLYHLGVPGFRGGYVGVDVFFVISGYLMTQAVLTKFAKGTFSAVDFYAARARRLAPALLVLCAVLLLVGFFVLLPLAYQALSKSILSSITFLSNVVFWQERGYFDAPSQTKWLLHTWSLSLEWQFYLVYPLFLAALAAFKTGRFLRNGVVVVFIASLVLSIVGTPLKQEASYFLLPTRMWELLAGALLYFWYRKGASARPLLVYVGLGLIVVATVCYSEKLAFPGFYAIIPVLGAVLVIAARSESRVLTNRGAQLLGDTSYSLYLWHWPFIVGARFLEIAFTPMVVLALAILSFGAALLSYRLVEVPFRTRGAGLSGGSYLLLAVGAAFCVALPAAVVYSTRGLPARVPPLVAQNDAVAGELAWEEACGNKRVCTVGPEAPKKVLFWGDSHAEQLLPAVQSLVEQGRHHGKQAIFHAHPGCMPVRNFAYRGGEQTCPEQNELTRARAFAADVDVVVIASIWTTYFRENPYDPMSRPTLCRADVVGCPMIDVGADALAAVRAQMVKDVGDLTAQGKTVILVAPVPQFDRDVPKYLADHAWSGVPVDLRLSRAAHDDVVAAPTAMLRDVAAATGATVLDPADVLCASGSCVYEQDAVSIYLDDNHLSMAGALLLAPALEHAFR